MTGIDDPDAAGWKIRVLGRRLVGGAAATEDLLRGLRNSTVSYAVSPLNPKTSHDLKLTDRSLLIVERPFPQVGADARCALPDVGRRSIGTIAARACSASTWRRRNCQGPVACRERGCSRTMASVSSSRGCSPAIERVWRDAEGQGFAAVPIIEILISSMVDALLVRLGCGWQGFFQQSKPDVEWETSKPQVAAAFILVASRCQNFRLSLLRDFALSPTKFVI